MDHPAGILTVLTGTRNRSTFDVVDQAGLHAEVVLFNTVQWSKDQLEAPNLFCLVCPMYLPTYKNWHFKWRILSFKFLLKNSAELVTLGPQGLTPAGWSQLAAPLPGQCSRCLASHTSYHGAFLVQIWSCGVHFPYTQLFRFGLFRLLSLQPLIYPGTGVSVVIAYGNQNWGRVKRELNRQYCLDSL